MMAPAEVHWFLGRIEELIDKNCLKVDWQAFSCLYRSGDIFSSSSSSSSSSSWRVLKETPVNLHQFEISEVEASRVRPLRTTVLRPWFDDDQWLEYESDDSDDTHHFAAIDRENQRIVGVVSYLPEPFPLKGDSASIRLRGMAVAEELRGQGLGSHLLSTTLPRIALYFPGARVWASARISVIDFYGRHGFEPVGPPYEMSSVGPQQRMVRQLPALIA
jgi:predicted GNAT family N-acyltransferase